MVTRGYPMVIQCYSPLLGASTTNQVWRSPRLCHVT